MNRVVNMEKDQRSLFFRSILAPILFEMCGIIPLLLVGFGLLNISAGITLRNTLVYQYTFLFFIVAAGLFVYSIYLFLKQRNVCSISGLKQHKNIIVLSLIVLTIFEAVLLIVIQTGEKLVYGQSPTNLSDFIPIGSFLIIVLLVFVFFLKVIKSH